MDFVIYALALIGLLSPVGALLCLLLVLRPSSSRERVRIEREAAEASWRIHQHAVETFGRMLSAARSTSRVEQDS